MRGHLVSTLLLCGVGATFAQSVPDVPLSLEARDFLFRPGPTYRDYSFSDYVIPDSSRYSRVNHYGPLGNFLIKGYDVYDWREVRTNTFTDEEGSSRRLPLPAENRSRWDRFERNIVAKESHKGWAAGLILGNEIRTLFTPLTLRLAGFDGVRLDAETDHTRFTTIAQRWTGPASGDLYGQASTWNQIDISEDVRDAGMLLGGHAEAEVGAASLGVTGVNFHLFDADQAQFSMRGGLQSPQVLPSFLIVRFADDSPEDGQSGAVINDVKLILNGEDRSDLRSFTVRIDAQNPTAVGVSTPTGFIRIAYEDAGTRFADVFYLQRHLAGENVERLVNLPELLRWVVPVPPGQRQLRADGHEVILMYYDLREEPYVQAVQVEALVGNDYRVDVVGLYQDQASHNREEVLWSTGGGQIVGEINGGVNTRQTPGVRALARSPGNVQDLSNLEWIRLNVGAWTGRALWGLNGSWESGGAQIRWEYARSVEYRQYPDGRPGFRRLSELQELRQWNGERSSTTSGAYYVTAQWRRGSLEGGGEMFSIEEEFHGGFVEDNDDDDRYPDLGPGHRSAISFFSYDPDGVFPGKDEDRDGIPDTNQNGNELPDYLEPFLRFNVEADEFIYGRDWNNNGIADEREDDLRPDFPYVLDQRGNHFYGRLYLPYGLGLTAGRLRARGITSGARNESLYARVSMERADPNWGHLRAETLWQRLHDDIEDPYQEFAETSTGPKALPAFQRRLFKDNLEWRDSVDRQHYLEGSWHAAPGFRFWGNVRYAVNRQRASWLADGSDQPPDRLGLLTAVAKSEYVWEPTRQWQVTGQYKTTVIRRTRDSLPLELINELTTFPILKVQYRLTNRTQIWFGMEGMPGLPVRIEDRADGFNSVEEKSRVLQLTNRSPYFGYEIAMNLGARTRSREFGDALRVSENWEATTIFMNVILGFDE